MPDRTHFQLIYSVNTHIWTPTQRDHHSAPTVVYCTSKEKKTKFHQWCWFFVEIKKQTWTVSKTIVAKKIAHRKICVWISGASLLATFGKAGTTAALMARIICNWCLLNIRKLDSYPDWLKGHFLLNPASASWRQMCRAHLQSLGNHLANALALLRRTPQCSWKMSSCTIGNTL